MAKPTPNTESIESLLEQRAQYEQWLAKLDSAANTAPAAVRAKVRSDYEARLRGVIDRLRGHSATIAGELERHRSSQADLDRQRRQAEEELAEAQVRHAVGEYTDEEWGEISRDSESRLNGIRDQLRSLGGEIARLAEVQSLIAGPARPPEPAERPAAVAAPEPEEAEAEEEEDEVEPPPPPAPRAAPKPSPAPAQVDELTFLKSVADDDLASAAARRPSNPGTSQRAAEHAPTPGPAAASPAATGGGGAKTGAAGVAKTLKCGECGTLNRPTEWYCERCGAELAGV